MASNGIFLQQFNSYNSSVQDQKCTGNLDFCSSSFRKVLMLEPWSGSARQLAMVARRPLLFLLNKYSFCLTFAPDLASSWYLPVPHYFVTLKPEEERVLMPRPRPAFLMPSYLGDRGQVPGYKVQGVSLLYLGGSRSKEGRGWWAGEEGWLTEGLVCKQAQT
jgi:hypothetical protein